MSKRLNEIKLVLVGDTNVGKTSLVTRYLYGKFGTPSATIAAQFMIKVVTFAGTSYKLQIWDTAGQERFRAMAPLYFRNADVALVVCDVEQASFASSIEFWIKQLQKSSSYKDLTTSVCVNKSDLDEHDWSITRQDLADLVEQSNAAGCDVYVTSAKENKGVLAMFQASIEKHLSNRPDEEEQTPPLRDAHARRRQQERDLPPVELLQHSQINQQARRQPSCC